MEIRETIDLDSREKWRKWLEKNHTKKKEIFAYIYKKHTNRELAYISAVEEALCFGWIDGWMRRIDEDKFILRFSPRRKKSIWSPHNVRRVKELIEKGKMTQAGLDIIPERIKKELSIS